MTDTIHASELEYEVTHGTGTPNETRAYLNHPVRTRTGTKVHAGSAGSSVTFCGVWLRVNGTHMRVRGTVAKANLCRSCYAGWVG